jgi:hypothetical protein
MLVKIAELLSFTPGAVDLLRTTHATGVAEVGSHRVSGW